MVRLTNFFIRGVVYFGKRLYLCGAETEMDKMKKIALLIVVVLAVVSILHAQKQSGLYAVAFYNQENLFDTIHDAGKNDYDFLPDGTYQWNKTKYEHKLRNMAKVLLELGEDRLRGVGASIIGMSEVENSRVLDQLIALPDMRKRGFKYVHIEGPDKRGIDCALLYNPKFFKPTKSFLKPYAKERPSDRKFNTRGFLTVQGTLAGDPLTVIVCHWPSRGSESYYREWAARQVRSLVDSIQGADPNQRIIVMGDVNDDPDNASMSKYLRARRKMQDVGKNDFYNPWWDVLRTDGKGTVSYQGKWNHFDQIVLSQNLLDIRQKKDYSHLTLTGYHIFTRPYLLQPSGKYKDTPLRTISGGRWVDGYSDHLPIVTYLTKETK